MRRTFYATGLLLSLLCCPTARSERPAPAADPAAARAQMVDRQLAGRDIDDPRVLAAMRAVPRHLFVPERLRHEAYADHPLPIGEDQTISQPYIVALMTQLADVKRGDKVLEVGTGSGYQAAVLAQLGTRVFSIEIIESLADTAQKRLTALGHDGVKVRHGDGYRGWPEEAPFDAILVTAAPPMIPEPLKQQLKVGGRLVIPVGERFQSLKLLVRTETGFEERDVTPVRFVPMTGEAQRRPAPSD